MLTSINVKNKTYFYHENTRSQNRVSSDMSFTACMQRRKDVFLRLYAEYVDCIKNGGIALFYTLTYAEHAITKYFGHNVHNYADIDWLFKSSGFVKTLQRNFNTRIRYALTSEFGEGGATHNYVGKRGACNNPHYHPVFFLTPIEKGKPIISPSNFLTLIQSYWQGMTIDKDIILYSDRIIDSNIQKDYTKFRFGFVASGQNLGVIYNETALQYVCKYVTKDSYSISVENSLLCSIRDYFRKGCEKNNDFMLDAIDNFISVLDDYNISLDSTCYGYDIVKYYPKEFASFLKEYRSICLTSALNIYHRYYKRRFRASRGLGYSVFTSDKFDKTEATILSVRNKKGALIPYREKLCGQLYRAWFYRVEKHDVYSKTQNKIISQSFYRPNGNLVQYRKSHLQESLRKLSLVYQKGLDELFVEKNFENFWLFKNSRYLCDNYKPLIQNDYVYFSRLLSRLVNRSERLSPASLFATYDYVYSSRSYDCLERTKIDCSLDYNRFLENDYKATFQEMRYTEVYPYDDKIKPFSKLCSYETHPYFADCMPLYDLVSQYIDYCQYFKGKEAFAQERKRREARSRIQGL